MMEKHQIQAGFARTEGFAFAAGGGNPQLIAPSYRIVLKPTIESIRAWILEQGLADHAHVDEL